MKKDLNVSNLIMLYGATLSERNRTILESYYDSDMSLFEIAEVHGMSRQGVRDILVRNTEGLYTLDAALRLQARFKDIKKACDYLALHSDNEVRECADVILERLFEE